MRTYLWMLDSGVLAGQIVIAGDSAGGGLALSVQTTLARQGLPLPGGTVLFCPAVDLSYDEEIELPAEPQPAISVAQLRSSPPPTSATPQLTTRWSTRCAPTLPDIRRC